MCSAGEKPLSLALTLDRNLRTTLGEGLGRGEGEGQILGTSLMAPGVIG